MNSVKQDYLTQIRSNTAYPTYRSIIDVIVTLSYLLAGLAALSGIFMGCSAMGRSFVNGTGILIGQLIVSALIFVGARFGREAALILADIGDAITEANSKPAQTP